MRTITNHHLATTGRRWRVVAAAGAAAVLIAACGGDDDAQPSESAPVTSAPPTSSTFSSTTSTPNDAPATTEPSSSSTAASTTPDTTATDTTATESTAAPTGTVVVTSDDGNVTLEVGAADAARIDPSVRVLDPSDWPAELGDADRLPGVTIYEMEPDGAQFDEPVRVTRRIDVAAFGVATDSLDVPIVVPFTQDDSGQFVPLDDLEVTRVGTSLFASGTTTHFSPLGTLDLGLDVSWPTSPVVVDPDTGEFFDAAIIEGLGERIANGDFENVPTAPTDEILALDGQTPDVTSRQATPPDVLPIFGATRVEEVTRTSPTQSGEEDAASLYRLLTSSDDVPSSPLFAEPGVAVPEALRLAVGHYLIAAEGDATDTEVERLADVADAMATGVGLRWEVIHTPLGGFPSFSRITLTAVPELEEGEQLFAAQYTGDFGPEAQLIDVAEMDATADGYRADVGLTSYGDVNIAFVLATGSGGPDILAGGDRFWRFAGGNDNVAFAMTVTDTTTGETQVFTVDAEERVGFDDPVGIQIYDAP